MRVENFAKTRENQYEVGDELNLKDSTQYSTLETQSREIM